MRSSLRTLCAGLAVTAMVATAGIGSAQAETIKIGFIGPLSGGNAQQGLGARNGFRLAIEQANGENLPFTLEGVILDDASDPGKGVSAAMRLVNDREVVAAIGHWNSPVALATTPVFNRNQIPMIVWGAISPAITEANLPFVTRVTPTLAQENIPLAQWAVEERGFERIAIVSDTSDYGNSNVESFREATEAAGGEIVDVQSFPVGTTDFRSLLTRVRDQEPDAIYFGGVIAEGGLVLRQMGELGMDTPLLGISGIHDEKVIEIAGSAAGLAIVSSPKVVENDDLEAFYEAYEAADFSDAPGPYAKYAYDATNLILAAIRDVGYEDKRALAQAIRNIEYEGTLGTTTFDSNGQTEIDVVIDILEVRDGEWVPVDTY